MQRIPDEFDVASTVITWYVNKTKTIKAQVDSDYSECEVGRRVALRKVRPGRTPRTLAVLSTNAMARVKLKNTYGAGRYFAAAKFKTFTDEFGKTGRCLWAKSVNVVRVAKK